jgi:putative transposase
VTKRVRAGYSGPVYHVVNHATKGQLLYEDFGEYLTFVRILAQTLDRQPVDLFAFSLMPNHFHLLLRPAEDRHLSAFMYDLTKTHAIALRRWRGDLGAGAVYKGRYRPSLVQTDAYFYAAARYVERNPSRAGLAERPKDWLWGSASRIHEIQGVKLAPWPVPRPEQWEEFVNQVEPARELAFIRRCVRRGDPLADPMAGLEDPALVRVPRIVITDKS